ncbi:PIR protein [Plasmodium ovale]|uniref:PIR protein n=1 Tax=Plasmodium ovale TaxID=36330 RepID=A0A1D3JFK6_PLAOA|nr:PIR protein [Plasmodium ovale]
MEKKAPKYDDLPSVIFYGKLNNNAEEYVNDKYWKTDENFFDPYPWVKNIFFKLKRNLSLIPNHDLGDIFYNKRCYDLNYWLYDQVFNNPDNNNDDKISYGIVFKLQEIWKNINNDKINQENKSANDMCYPDSNLFDMKFLKQMKDLFDFIEDFLKVRKEAVDDTKKACLKYVEYLRERVPIYYGWDEYCVSQDENTCTRYIKNYKNYNPKDVLSDLGPLIYITFIFNNCYLDVVDIFLKAEEAPRFIAPQKINVLGEGDNVVEIFINNISQSRNSVKKYAHAEDSTDSTSTSLISVLLKALYYIGNYGAPVTLSLLGTVMIFFLLYKFTSFGLYLLRIRARIRRKFGPNIRYDDMILLDDSSDSSFSGSNESLYSISYLPL